VAAGFYVALLASGATTSYSFLLAFFFGGITN
jgi:hypothetical protein